MRATGLFRVASFDATELDPAPMVIATGLPTGVAIMEKQYEGEISGRSATIFVSAFDPDGGAGTYVAMESFDGVVNGITGTFNFVHAASMAGTGRSGDHFQIVPGSGTGGLTSIRGAGGLRIEDDGRHVMWFDYELD